VLEAVHRDLAEDGRERVFDLVAEHRQPHLRIGFLLHHGAEDQHLAKGRGHLGGGQRGVGLQHPLLAREVLVHAVAQLVGQRHHVAGAAGVVHEHVRVHRGDRAGAVGAVALVGLGRRVDPRLAEELAGDVGHLGMEAPVGVQHHLARAVPLVTAFGGGQRRVAVIIGQAVQAQDRALERVIAGHDVVA